MAIYWKKIFAGLKRLFGGESFVFPVTAVILICISQFMDIEMFQCFKSGLIEETLEFYAALALLLYPIHSYRIYAASEKSKKHSEDTTSA